MTALTATAATDGVDGVDGNAAGLVNDWQKLLHGT
jgi:glycerate-2-kinase